MTRRAVQAHDLLQLIQAGPWVTLIGYMVWDKTQDRKLARERIGTDLEVARALANLAARIDGMRL